MQKLEAAESQAQQLEAIREADKKVRRRLLHTHSARFVYTLAETFDRRYKN